MSKKVGVLVENNYQELELWYPLLRLREAGYETFTIGPEQGTVYESKKGYPAKADYSIDQIKAEELAALVVPGGWAPDYWRTDPRFVNLVRDMVNAGQIVGTICHGAWMLCSAKVIKGRKLTCFKAIKDDVENAGGLFEDSPLVVDGNLVTSRIPADLPDFCKGLLKKLES